MSNVDRVAVWGASGSGKSTYVKGHIRTRKRIVAFDPMHDHGGELATSLAEVRRIMRHSWNRFRISYRPPSGAEVEALSRLSALLIHAQQPFADGKQKDPLTLVVEEMNLSFPTGSARRCPGFADVCSRGRHYGIEVVGVSQRVAEVDTRFRGNASMTIAFRQQGPRDRQAAAAELGVSPDELPQENFRFLKGSMGQISSHKLTKPRR